MVGIPEWYIGITSWPSTIAEITDMDIDPGDAMLIRELARDITQRWRATAGKGPNSFVEFERLYKANIKSAKAAIVAVLELVKVVGAGKPLKSGMESLVKR